MLSSKGPHAAIRPHLSLRLLPLILMSVLLSSGAQVQRDGKGVAGRGSETTVADATVAVANSVQATNGNFGSVNVGATSADPVAVTFTFDASVTVGSIAVVTQGATGLDFTDAGGGTCKANTAYNAGDSCTVKVNFKPRAPGARYGAAELLDASGNLLANGYVQGTGVGPQVTFANTTSGSGTYVPSKQRDVGSGLAGPLGVTVDAAGNAFIVDGGAVKEILAVNGSIPPSPAIKTLGSGLQGPYGLAVDGAGNVFVGDRILHEVKEIIAAGGYTTVKTLGSGFNLPNGMAVDGSGNVFVADWGNNAVYEIVAAGGYTTVRTLESNVNIADYVAVDGNNNVYVAAFESGVQEILAAGGYTTIKTLATGVGYVSSVALDASGNLFITDYGSGVAREILASDGYATVKTLASGFSIPNGVVVDGSGNVFIGDTGNRRLVRLDYSDPPTLTFGKASVGAESSDSPQTVLVSNNGNTALTFPIPTAGRNPTISTGFTLDSATTCPDLGTSSTAGELAMGASCNYAIDFIPVAGTTTGSVILTDNSLNASPAVTQTISLSGTTIGPHLAFTTPPPASLAVGQRPGTVAVSVEDSSDTVMTGSSATITLTVTGPNAYSKVYTANAANGIATFSSLDSLSTAGTYSYTATDVPDGLTQAVATETVWVPHLVFTTPPPAILAVGHVPGTVAVSVDDPGNNVMTTSSATITLTVTGPNSYSKAYTATAANGVGTFSSLDSLSILGNYSYTTTDVPAGMTQAVAAETVAEPPSAVSMTPSSGLGYTQQFSFVAGSPNGPANLSWLVMLFNTTPSPEKGCYLHYGVASNRLYLLSDNGKAWAQGQPGTAGTLSNSQCSVDLAATTTVAGNNTLTVSPAITFNDGFKAGVQTYMFVADIPGLNSGWQRLGRWMVGDTAEAAPSAVSVTPSSGYGTTQQFSFVASSPNGAANLSWLVMLFNTTQSPQNGCYLHYSVIGNQLYLLSDDGKAWTQGPPGTAGTLSNFQCSVDLATTTAVASGNTLTVSPAITFNAGFKAGLQTYMFVTDIPGLNSGWQRLGWWMVGSTLEAAPSAVSVTPASGYGNTQQFSFVASSPNGAANLAWEEMIFNTSLSHLNSCSLHHGVTNGLLYLLSDDGKVWGTGQRPGTAGTLSNSQCSVDLATTTVVASGNTLTVSPSITFKGGFNTGLKIYMVVTDVPGLTSGWQKMSP
jgi:hypothetical protein